MKGKIIFILFLVSYSFPVMAGDGKYAVSTIPPALLKNAHVIKRMEKISFEVINTGEAILRKKYALTIMDENGDEVSFPSAARWVIKMVAVKPNEIDTAKAEVKRIRENQAKG